MYCLAFCQVIYYNKMMMMMRMIGCARMKCSALQ